MLWKKTTTYTCSEDESKFVIKKFAERGWEFIDSERTSIYVGKKKVRSKDMYGTEMTRYVHNDNDNPEAYRGHYEKVYHYEDVYKSGYILSFKRPNIPAKYAEIEKLEKNLGQIIYELESLNSSKDSILSDIKEKSKTLYNTQNGRVSSVWIWIFLLGIIGSGIGLIANFVMRRPLDAYFISAISILAGSFLFFILSIVVYTIKIKKRNKAIKDYCKNKEDENKELNKLKKDIDELINNYMKTIEKLNSLY